MPERPPTIPERIGAAAGEPPPEGIPIAPESWRSPEDGAEQLYALWRDYNRRKVGVYRRAIAQYWKEHKTISPPPPEGEREGVAKTGEGVASEGDARRIPDPDRAALMAAVDTDPSLSPLREAIRVRARVPDIRQVFERHLDRIHAQEEHIQPTRAAYEAERQRHDTARSKALEIYRDIFAHRDREPEEIDLLDLAGFHAQITAAQRTMDTAERANPELATQLSFERLTRYRDELAHGGFVWTPSREQYFDSILEHLVVLDQNRPVLLAGETGTGKTRLARAVAERLTGRPPFEVGEEAKADIRPLLGTPQMDKEGSYVAYGPLGQALTGKATSRDTESDGGGIAFLDEANGYPPDGHRAVIKQIAGRKPGEEVGFAAWRGKRERVARQFGLIESANLPSPKHPDRQPFPVEITRELTTFTVDYPAQTPEDPELYEMLLAACLDQNDRLRIPKDAIAPKWDNVVDTVTNTKREELDTAPIAGGALWRFANCIADIQRAYTGQENALTPTRRDASYLKVAVLDVGLPIAWLQEYRKTNLRRGEPLDTFLADKLAAWSRQETFPESDRNLLAEFLKTYGFLAPPSQAQAGKHRRLKSPVEPGGKTSGVEEPVLTILSPSDIGALSPRVPRAPEFLGDTPDATTANATLEDGTIVKYLPTRFGDVPVGVRFHKISFSATGGRARGGGTEGEWVGEAFTFKGLTVGDDHTPANHAVLEGPDGIAQIIALDALTTDFERERSRELSYDAWSTELDAFARGLGKPFAEGERTIEALIQRQEQFYRDRYQDSSFTIDRAQLTLPRERLDAWKDALERGEADYPLVVAPPRTLKPEEERDPALANQPRTLHRVLFDRLIREKGIKMWERTDPDLTTFLEQVRDLTLADLTRTDIEDSEGNTLTFDKDHWLAYLQALYPTLPRPDATTATPTIGFVKWEGDPPNDRAIPGTTKTIANQSQLDAVRLRYPLATPSQWLTLFAQYHAKTGKPLDDLTKPAGTWSWLFGIIDPVSAFAGPSVLAHWDTVGLHLHRYPPGYAYTRSRLRSSR